MAQWAASAGIGPGIALSDEVTGVYVMDFLVNEPIEREVVTERLTDVCDILRGWHTQPIPEWIDIVDQVSENYTMLAKASSKQSLPLEDEQAMKQMTDEDAKQPGEISSHHAPCYGDMVACNLLLGPDRKLEIYYPLCIIWIGAWCAGRALDHQAYYWQYSRRAKACQ